MSVSRANSDIARFVFLQSRCLTLLALAAAIMQVSATDWPRFRGPDLRGVSAEPILQTWPTNGPPILWQVPAPGGYSSLAVAGGTVFTLRNTTNECCVARDAGSGTQRWSTALGPSAAYSTPTVKDERVYVYSGRMKLFCLNATNGGILWQRDLIGEFGSNAMPYGNSQSPWVEDGRVFVSVLAATNCLLAFNATNGTLLWRGHTNALTYGSPLGAAIHGTRQIIFPDPWGLAAVAPENGRLLWRQARGYSSAQHGPSPVVSGDIVVCVKSDSSGGEAFRVLLTNGVFSTKTLWTNARLSGTFVTLVAHEGYLYGVFDNKLQCLALASGQVTWRTNFYASPSIILADNQLLLLGQYDRALTLATASPLCYEQLAQCTLPFGEYLNSPTFSQGRIYVRCPDQIVCLAAAPPAALEIGAGCLPGGTHLRLTVGRKDGKPIETNRAPCIFVRWSSTLDSSPRFWPVLPGALVYTNGMIYGDAPLVRNEAARFFIAVETAPSPPLEISAAPWSEGTQLRLAVRCRNGSSIRTDRVPRIHLSWSRTLDWPPDQWPVWSGELMYTNGALYGDTPLLRNEPARYFIAVEEP